MKKYKRFQLISSVLIGVGALVSVPVLITSCKKSNNPHKFIDASFDSVGIKVNMVINNLPATSWNDVDISNGTIMDSGNIDVTNFKIPNDFQIGWMNADGYMEKVGINPPIRYNISFLGIFSNKVSGGTFVSWIHLVDINPWTYAPTTIVAGQYDVNIKQNVGYTSNNGTDVTWYQQKQHKERITITG